MLAEIMCPPPPGLVLSLPDYLNAGFGGPVLYVGCNVRRFQMLDLFPGCAILESFAPYVDEMREDPRFDSHALIHGRLERSSLEKYRTVVWWHGPEHMPRRRVEDCLQWTRCNWIVGCPVGEMPQDEIDDNPDQRHVSQWLPADFRRLGFAVRSEGYGRGSSLVAVRRSA
jgi:hypothetical protein